MKIIYVSSATSRNTFKQISKLNKKITSEAVQKYNNLLMKGISLNAIDVISISTAPLTGESRRRKVYVKYKNDNENDVEYKYIPIINLPILKQITMSLYNAIYIYKECRGNDNNFICCDILNFTGFISSYFISKIMNVPIIGIVTDIPKFINTIGKAQLCVYDKILHNLDSYVFLTQEMSEVINANNKPFTVIEGLVDNSLSDVNISQDNLLSKKIKIMYAGGIREIYGLGYLVEGFIKADIQSSELHIYGDGDYKQKLEGICKTHKNVYYHGFVLNEVVLDAQKSMDVLVNPRPSDAEYTKYSFPSKNMEYMVSGKTVLTTKLPGMPKEYYPYVMLVEEETTNGFSDKFIEISNLKVEFLNDFGRKSKEFVISQKNNKIMANKLIQLIKSSPRKEGKHV